MAVSCLTHTHTVLLPLLQLSQYIISYSAVTHTYTRAHTFLAVVKLVELAGLRLLKAGHYVVCDVAVGVVGRFPLQDDLRGGVGGGDGVQRHRRL